MGIIKRLMILGELDLRPEYSRNQVILSSLLSSKHEIIDRSIHLPLMPSYFPLFFRIFWMFITIPIRWAMMVLKYLSCQQVDYIFVPYPAYLDAPIALFLSKTKNAKVIVDAFFSLYDTLVNDRKILKEGSVLANIIWRYERWLYSKVDKVLVDTPQQIDLFKSVLGINGRNIVNVPVGIDEKIWIKSNTPGMSDDYRVIFWGTFIPLHGVETIVQAAKIISKIDSKIKIKVIGTGQTEDLFKRYVGMGRNTNLIWIRKFVPIEYIRDELINSQLCLGIFGNSYKAQSVIPYKIHQALACGCPVITAETKATNYYFTHKKNIFLVPPKNPQSLAQAIIFLKNNPEISRQIGRYGNTLYQRKFSSRVIKKIIKELIEE